MKIGSYQEKMLTLNQFGIVGNYISNISIARLNGCVALVAGLFFFIGWWLMFDLHAIHPELISENETYYLPGVFATLSFLIVSSVPMSFIKSASGWGVTKCRRMTAVLILFFGLIAAFGSLIGASFILMNDYLLDPKTQQKWPGFAIFLQNLFIVSSNLMMKFGRKHEDF